MSDEPTQIEPLLWNAGQTATALSVSEATILNLHRTHQLEGVMIGKHLRWVPGRVVEFVNDLAKKNGKE